MKLKQCQAVYESGLYMVKVASPLYASPLVKVRLWVTGYLATCEIEGRHVATVMADSQVVSVQRR